MKSNISKSIFKKISILSIFIFNNFYANPQNLDVSSGSANLQASSDTLNITTSDKSILNWDSFSINANETTNFIMPASTSISLNRVMGQDLSSLMGKLNANGKIILVNPNGILIGNSAYINTFSFIGSTFDVLDQDFLNDEEYTFKGDSLAKIENYGSITATDGDVFLIGYQIKNFGEINAKKSVAGIGAGKEIILKSKSKEKIFIKSKSLNKDVDIGIENDGKINAAQIELKADGNPYTLAIKNSKTLDALGTKVVDGKVLLVAENGRNESYGDIKAQNFDGSGGEVRLLGKEVGLLGLVDVSSINEMDGGVVLFGGDYQGKNEDIINASAIFMGKDALINASANEIGSGGRVILWSDDATHFFGDINVEGGSIKGDGGFVEVSSKDYLNVQGMIYAKAENGVGGKILFDPTDILIGNDADLNVIIEGLASGEVVYKINPSDVEFARINIVQLNNILDQANTVEINTHSTGFNPGNITIESATHSLIPEPGILTLIADNLVLIKTLIDIQVFGKGFNINAQRVTIDASSKEAGIRNTSPNCIVNIDTKELNILASASHSAFIEDTTTTGSGGLNLSSIDTDINITSTSAFGAFISSIKELTLPGNFVTITSNGKIAHISSASDLNLFLNTLRIINNATNEDAYVQSTGGNITIDAVNNISVLSQSPSTKNAYINTTGAGKNIDIIANSFNISADNAAATAYIATNNGSIDIKTNDNSTSFLNSSIGSVGESYIAINETTPNTANTLKIRGGPLFLGPNAHIRSVNRGDIEIYSKGISLNAIAASSAGTTDIIAGTAPEIGNLTINTHNNDINLNATEKDAFFKINTPTSNIDIKAKNLTLNAGSGKAYIEGANEIDLSGNLNLNSSASKVAEIAEVGGGLLNIKNVKDINLTGDSSNLASISADRIDINSSGSINLNKSSSINSAADINITLHGDLNLTAGGASEIAQITSTGGTDGNITINSGGSVTLTGGSNASAKAIILSASGVANNQFAKITTANNFNLISNTGVASVEAPGFIEIFAGDDITANASSKFESTSSYITLVVDNDNPSFPKFGNGKFVFPASGVTFTTGANQVVSLYSSLQSKNEIPNGTTINGNVFNKGTIGQNTSTEQWGELGIYYPSVGNPPFGPGFIFYYKITSPGDIISQFLAYENKIHESMAEMFYRLRRYTPIILHPFTAPLKKYIAQNEKYKISFKNELSDDEKKVNEMKINEEKQRLMEKENEESKSNIKNSFKALFEKIKNIFK